MIRLIICILMSSFSYAEVDISYTIKQADTTENISIVIDNIDRPNYINYNSKYTQTWKLKETGHTSSWVYENVSENSHITIRSNNSNFIISGRYRGKEVNSTISTLNAPWIQYIDAYFPTQLVLNGLTQITYIRSRDLKPIKLSIKQKTTDDDGLYHFQAYIRPFPALFWRMDFWVDKHSQLIVKKRVSGSPTLFMTKHD